MGKYLCSLVLMCSLEALASRGTNFRKQGEAVTRHAVIDLELCDGKEVDGCELPTVFLRPSAGTALEFPSEVEGCSEDAEFIDLLPIVPEETVSKAVVLKKYLIKLVNAEKLANVVRGTGRGLADLPAIWFHCQVRVPKSNDLVLKTINVAIGRTNDEWRDGNARVRFHLPSARPVGSDLSALTKIVIGKPSSDASGKTKAKSRPVESEGKPGQSLQLTDAEREMLSRLPKVDFGKEGGN